MDYFIDILKNFDALNSIVFLVCLVLVLFDSSLYNENKKVILILLSVSAFFGVIIPNSQFLTKFIK